jgi:3-deoxy-D-manno-octulosonic-acid transferase
MPAFVYTALLYLALPFVPLKLLWRSIKQPEYLQHWGERFGYYSSRTSKPVIWIHCVSVGETRAAEPLVKLLLSHHPDYQIVITHTTPTGRATSEQLFHSQVLRVYLPYDVPFAVNGFLNHFKPTLGILMETELWFNLIHLCKHQAVPLLLLNARLSFKSANGYLKLGNLVREGMQSLSLIAAQSAEDMARFEMLGASNVVVTGNLKFDVSAPEDSLKQGAALRELLGKSRTIFMAASTRDGEEELILDALMGLKDLKLLTMIVPRHPQRFDEVEVLLSERKIKYLRRTDLTQPIPQDTEVILGNTMGEMFTYYAACDFAFVGGSLLKFGGQNLIEPASMGKPVIIGKYIYNFADAARAAVKCGAATQVKDVDDLKKRIEALAMHPSRREAMSKAAITFSQSSTGATARVMKVIEGFLPSRQSD